MVCLKHPWYSIYDFILNPNSNSIFTATGSFPITDAMKWSNNQVVTMDKQVRVRSRKVRIHNETALLDYYKWNLADLLIYQYFKLKVQQKVDTEKTYYPSEAQALRLAREAIYDDCVEERKAVNQTTSSGSTIENYEYKLKPYAAPECRIYTVGIKTMWSLLKQSHSGAS